MLSKDIVHTAIRKRLKSLSLIGRKWRYIMGINLGNFFIKKPLRWAFSQAFGSKAKVWFDSNVSGVIDIAMASGIFNYETAVSKFLDGNFVDGLLKQASSNLGIPKKYEGVARDFIKSEIEKQIKAQFNK